MHKKILDRIVDNYFEWRAKEGQFKASSRVADLIPDEYWVNFLREVKRKDTGKGLYTE